MLNFYGDSCMYPNPEADEPGGQCFTTLEPAQLLKNRNSIKYRRFSEDVLPLFIAEMDFCPPAEVAAAICERVTLGDLGYIHSSHELAEAFSEFAGREWGWHPNTAWLTTTSDLGTALVELVRTLSRTQLAGNNPVVALNAPSYNGFYETLPEVPNAQIVEVPFLAAAAEQPVAVSGTVLPRIGFDFTALEAAFRGDYTPPGSSEPAPAANILLLANPQNPQGAVWTKAELTTIARLAARYQVTVISDEVHAPLTLPGHCFTPFAPLAAEHNVTAFVLTSASKTYNIVGLKCAIVIAANQQSAELLKQLPQHFSWHTSILGCAAGTAAFRFADQWRTRLLERIAANVNLFHTLLAEQVPQLCATVPGASYLSWVDFRNTAIAADPFTALLNQGKLALSDGKIFGSGGSGFLRINLGCAPATINTAVERIATVLR